MGANQKNNFTVIVEMIPSFEIFYENRDEIVFSFSLIFKYKGFWSSPFFIVRLSNPQNQKNRKELQCEQRYDVNRVLNIFRELIFFFKQSRHNFFTILQNPKIVS